MKYVVRILILLLLIFALSGTRVQAQEEDQDAPVMTPTPAPVAYTLPYPGLLPGQFLYPLRALRDRIMSVLISSPIKKADFNLLQADKRVAASYVLVTEKNQVATAVDTFSKAENYFRQAVADTTDAKKQGMDSSDMIKKLTLSNQKHKEVLQNLEKGLSAKDKEEFAQTEKQLKELTKSVSEIR